MRAVNAIGLLVLALQSTVLLHSADALAQTIAVDPGAGGARSAKAPCKAECPDFYEGGLGGLRVSSTRVVGSDRARHGAGIGLQLSGHNNMYGFRRGFSYRSTTFFLLGGGARGFEGGLGADLAWGWRVPVAPKHGPLVRLGMRGYLLGNNELYASLLELPQVQLGYQWMRGAELLELAGHAGAVLAGRYNTGEHAYRKLGDAFELGGHAAAHLRPVHLELGFARVLTDSSPGDPVDTVTGQLCGQAVFAWLCVDARYYRGNSNVLVGSGVVDAVYAGFSVGAGPAAFR